mmetsp:Transcript_11294/g.15375  ORF Transcript_11294/g.15375 Transcript_11294/m.15375 type:complete len:84 (-) Transcript_11294:12-263(-)
MAMAVENNCVTVLERSFSFSIEATMKDSPGVEVGLQQITQAKPEIHNAGISGIKDETKENFSSVTNVDSTRLVRACRRKLNIQ